MNTPNQTIKPNDVLRMMWEGGQLATAEATERDIRSKYPTQKLWSSNTQKWLDRFITVDKDLIEMKKEVQLIQMENDPVLIIGDTGTGKELIANALHGARIGKFVAVNCTSLPSELIESELFGHIKGAFTGAVTERVGKFRAAWKGTIFLDEIGDMPMDMQAKLLRVLQEGIISPIGSEEEIKIECRVVAATNKSIEQLLEGLHFREDLFYRLSTFILKTKPIIQRPEDIEPIIKSLGGDKLIEAYKSWKLQDPSIRGCQGFFNLSGNVRSLAAQVRRYQVLGKLA